MVLPFPHSLLLLHRFAWFGWVVPRFLIVLGALDDDNLQGAIERLNLFRCVLTQDSFLTHALSQRKGMGKLGTSTHGDDMAHQFERAGVQHGEVCSVPNQLFLCLFVIRTTRRTSKCR